ncbi:FAD-dependent oxidoreductase [Brachybacterium avium]|uniref:FAD-dependent oxidoreductase n=1 Tax=Brachybacterium avium TaxID=2017485 RepID=A0A220U9R8_9MICO|nr:FAD-dependent oxidoreductase [Brachybacterium avium]ASK64868.1 FAD-dependent oxidoreductase [Brachybacterium avium]
MEQEHIVLVGGGLAGAHAAAELRKRGFDGDLTLLSDEAERPYDHVPLSKEFLHGGHGYHPLFLHDEGFYREHRIDLRLEARVSRVDPDDDTVHLDGGEKLRYSAALLATGAAARRLPLPGAVGATPLAGVHHLRTLGEAERLRSELRAARRVVVIGAGLLGCEITASAAALGKDVALLSRGPLPLASALGTEMATVYRDLHLEHGVRVLSSVEAAELRGSGRVDGVLLTDGRTVPADLVVIAVGAVPRTGLAEAAGLAVGDGIITDSALATSAPRLYAAGDVASVWYPRTGRHERRDHFATARTQGKAVARSMLGERVCYDEVPFFFSDQYDVWMEHTGAVLPGAELVVHGDTEARRFVAFWMRDGQITAAMNMGLKGVPDAVTPLIHAGEQVSDRDLRRIVADARPA